jgi:hypothetical protein
VNNPRISGKLNPMTYPLPSGGPEIVDPKMAQRRWAECAQERLEALTDAVGDLRVAFDTPDASEAASGARLKSAVTDACFAITEWLNSSHAPRGLRKAEGELAATAGVYRNAAVAFGSLSDAESDQFEARYKACAKLLQQGDHHVEICLPLLRKKL